MYQELFMILLHTYYKLLEKPFRSSTSRFAKLLKNLELLIIDEVSMVRAPMLDAISQSLQMYKISNTNTEILRICGTSAVL